jgi:hypothetical protein
MLLDARQVVAVIAAGSAVLTAARTADAQEFRVSTTVYDLSARTDGGRPPVVARAETLFHAGKAYDLLEGADEVRVFEPTERRFRVVSPKRGVTATVAFDEIRQLLKGPRDTIDGRLAELAGKNSPDAARATNFLRFQLDPRFQETFDPAAGILTLDGRVIRYDVKSADPRRPEIVATYLDYADWTTRLNYLLSPGPILPDIRCALNQALRAKGQVPEAVTLRIELSPPLVQRAEHSLKFALNDADRNKIRQWEAMLSGGGLRQVPLPEYQRAVLAARSK